MEDNVLVKVENLSKKFCIDLKTSLWYGAKDLLTNISGDKKNRELRPKEFWAVKNINFELRRGECLGLIGHNGAGKSTLLKILNGLIKPDEGKVSITGRVGALIELGAGFNPILSGRENIYNNGAVLGFTKEEIASKVETIINFSEIRDFIDMPVQNYSSGMKVRLGFAVASQMEPDVLIIDEVLAVGDLGFTIKCFNTIDKLLPNTAIIFVSHSMHMVSRVCNQILLLENGQRKFQGTDVAKGIDLYYGKFTNNNRTELFSDSSIDLIDVQILTNSVIDNVVQVEWYQDFQVYFKFKLNKHFETVPKFVVTVIDKEQRPIATLNHNSDDSDIKIIDNHIEFIIEHSNIELSKGIYTLDIIVQKTHKKDIHLALVGIASFQLTYNFDIYPPFLLKTKFKDATNKN